MLCAKSAIHMRQPLSYAASNSMHLKSQGIRWDDTAKHTPPVLSTRYEKLAKVWGGDLEKARTRIHSAPCLTAWPLA